MNTKIYRDFQICACGMKKKTRGYKTLIHIFTKRIAGKTNNNNNNNNNNNKTKNKNKNH